MDCVICNDKSDHLHKCSKCSLEICFSCIFSLIKPEQYELDLYKTARCPQCRDDPFFIRDGERLVKISTEPEPKMFTFSCPEHNYSKTVDLDKPIFDTTDADDDITFGDFCKYFKNYFNADGKIKLKSLTPYSDLKLYENRLNIGSLTSLQFLRFRDESELMTCLYVNRNRLKTWQLNENCSIHVNFRRVRYIQVAFDLSLHKFEISVVTDKLEHEPRCYCALCETTFVNSIKSIRGHIQGDDHKAKLMSVT